MQRRNMPEHWREVSSPGQGITEAPLSIDPLATEGEATPGPDDWNPYEDEEFEMEMELLMGSGPDIEDDDISRDREPTAGDDPFVFDDVEDHVDGVALPSLQPEMDNSLF